MALEADITVGTQLMQALDHSIPGVAALHNHFNNMLFRYGIDLGLTAEAINAALIAGGGGTKVPGAGET